MTTSLRRLHMNPYVFVDGLQLVQQALPVRLMSLGRLLLPRHLPTSFCSTHRSPRPYLLQAGQQEGLCCFEQLSISGLV